MSVDDFVKVPTLERSSGIDAHNSSDFVIRVARSVNVTSVAVSRSFIVFSSERI